MRVAQARGNGLGIVLRSNNTATDVHITPRTQVTAVAAKKQSMENSNDIPFGPGHPRYEEVQALESTVRAVRRAQGKKNPEDFAYGSPEWRDADVEYICNLVRALGGSPDAFD